MPTKHLHINQIPATAYFHSRDKRIAISNRMLSANIESDLTVMVTELLPSKGIQKHSHAFLKY